MLLKLILLLTLTPILELYVLLQLAKIFSVAPTIALVLGTGVLGGILARSEGLRVLMRIQKELHEGTVPGDALLEGTMILIAGALLITPGIITDIIGFLVLIPPSRRMIRKLLKAWLQHRIDDGQVEFYKQAGFGPINDEPPPGSPPLEGEENDESSRQQ